jgi:hypothetical protein
VRLVPHQFLGVILLLQEEEQQAYRLVWGPNELFPSTQTELQIPNGCTVVDIHNVAQVTLDIPSSTLLLTLCELVDGQQGLLFHPIDSPDFADQIRSLVTSRPPEQVRTQQQTIDDTLFDTFDTFSRVSRFYYKVARNVFGAEDITRRPRSASPGAIVNPWITHRPLDLPSSRRRKGGMDSLFSTLDIPDVIFRTFMFTAVFPRRVLTNLYVRVLANLPE